MSVLDPRVLSCGTGTETIEHHRPVAYGGHAHHIWCWIHWEHSFNLETETTWKKTGQRVAIQGTSLRGLLTNTYCILPIAYLNDKK